MTKSKGTNDKISSIEATSRPSLRLQPKSQWLNGDASLTNLPFILPPTHFATTTHLNQHGVTEYTKLLSESAALK